MLRNLCSQLRKYSQIKVEQVNKFKEGKKQNKKQVFGPHQINFTPQPVVASKVPYYLKNPSVASKKYRWCSCGMSAKQPFCDGKGHKGTAFKPVVFSLEQPYKGVWLCGCKLSSKKPFCDGQVCADLNNEKINSIIAERSQKASLEQSNKTEESEQTQATETGKEENKKKEKKEKVQDKESSDEKQ